MQNTSSTIKPDLKDRRKVDTLLESLVFLTKYYQRSVSAESLISGLAIHNKSIDIDKFIQSSKRVGLISKVVQRDLKGISKLALPCVLLLEKERSCVLVDYDLDKEEATVIMPGLSEGETKMSFEHLQGEYLGNVIIVKPSYNFENKVSKDIIIPKPKKWFFGALATVKDIYIRVVISAIFINIFIIATPLFTMNVYDRVLPNNAIETLWILAIGIFLVLSFDFILKLIRSYYIGKAGKRADIIMSNRIFDQVLNIKLSEKPSSTGQFVSRLQSFESVREFFTSATVATLVDVPFIILFTLVIFYIGGPLGYISLFTIFIALAFSFYMQKPIKNTVEKSAKEDQIKQTTLNESVAGLEIIKTVRAQNRMKTHWEESLNQTSYYNEKSQFLSQVASFFTAYISSFSNIAIVIGGVYLAGEGELTMGGIIASMMLNSRIIGPVGQIVNMVIRFDRTMISLENIEEIMKMAVERDEKKFLSRPYLSGDIEFKDVSFSYKDQNFEALKNININIKQGERVAILGKIGSGKSTLAKILMNLYEPTKGSVLVDKTDVRQIDPVDLRRSVGCVPQEPYLFMGSVKDNITIGEQYVSDEEVLKASKIAGVHEFIGKHESGYDLMVGERGEGLSGGERQSITLARAIITNPNILVLDEPTNAMDRQTEKAFMKNLDENISKDKTLIIITHKLSLLDLVDRVIILNEGRVVADGPKEKVLVNRPKGEQNNEK